MPLPAGTRLGVFEIVAPLGAGGMGEVYRARDLTLDRDVALKVLPSELADDAQRRAWLVREARAAATLNHPNICTVHAVGEEGRRVYLAMELVGGHPLSADVLKGPMPSDLVLRYGIQIADAVGHAHDRGVVHRDLKSANIMITPEGRAKVLDFGLAKRSGSGPLADVTTRSEASFNEGGAMFGTLPYMAPEQLRGEPADARSDVWSLGVILYEMAAGLRPFAGQSGFDLASSILTHVPVPPTGVPPALQSVILRCLDKEPTRRYQRASELHAALEMIHHGPLVPVQRRRFRVSLSPRGLAGVAGFLAILVSALVLTRMSGTRSAVVPPSIESLAILPLDDLTAGADQPYFADGMTEALITNMASIDGLRVVPRSAVMLYRDTPRSSAEIARELGVDAILEGSIVRSGDLVRVTAHLIDPETNRDLWAQSYERHMSDVLAVQSEVALSLAEALRVRLTSRTQTRLMAEARPVNPAAYDLYLRALTRLNQVNRVDAEAAVAELEQATALDPTFAGAFATLANAYSQLYGSYDPEQASRLEPKVVAAIEKALSLDPDSPDALSAQGALLWDRAHGWRHEEAIDVHRKALAVNPNYFLARLRLATIYNHIGLPDAARRELVEADESPAVLMQKGLAFHIQSRHDLALTSWLAIPERLRNTNHIGHIAWVLSNLERYEEAWGLLRRVPPDTVDVNGMLSAAQALLHAISGERERAERLIAAATARATDTQESHHATYLVAAAYARLGNSAESLRWLRFTASNGYPCYPLFAEDRNLDSLRSHAPFIEFLGELRSRWEGYSGRLGR